jgi:ATP-binding cassette, subfamily A (ABC1), member 3
VKSLTTSDRDVFSAVLVVLFFYGPAAAGYSCCWSFAFTSPSLCNIFLIVSGFLIGFAGPLITFVLTLIGSNPFSPSSNLLDIANLLKALLRFLPTFCLENGVYTAINIDLYGFVEGDENLSAWSDKLLLYDVVALVIQTLVYTGLAILLDIWSSNPQIMASLNKIFCACFAGGPQTLDVSTALPEDDDVVAEQDRVNSGGANSDLIVVSQLTKIYRNGKTAVNNFSLGIPPGECFGLLGINGE